jgi:DMSO reductase family type II enzyme heme b subunit
MQVKQLDIGAQEFGDPDSGIWSGITARKVSLVPAPVAMQPSKYILGKWKDGEYGKVGSLGVQVLHNGKELAIRLEWENPQSNLRRFENNDFPDGAAILFPLTQHASLFMGAPGEPVDIWHWRADRPDSAHGNLATGIGTSEVMDEDAAVTRSLYKGGRWAVVYRRALSVAAPATQVAQFAVGETIRMAFAVWDGGNAERGGLKAFSPQWLEVTPES